MLLLLRMPPLRTGLQRQYFRGEMREREGREQNEVESRWKGLGKSLIIGLPAGRVSGNVLLQELQELQE